MDGKSLLTSVMRAFCHDSCMQTFLDVMHNIFAVSMEELAFVSS